MGSSLSSQSWYDPPADGQFGMIDEASEVEGYGVTFWNRKNMTVGSDGKKTFTLKDKPPTGECTAWECINNACERFPEANAVGWRQLVKEHKVDGFQKLELANEYTWLTFKEYADRIKNLSSALMALEGAKEQTRVVIYAETQMDWMCAAFAAWRSRMQVVTIYATLGEDGAKFGLTQTKSTIVFVDTKLTKTLLKILPSCKDVKHVIEMGAASAEIKEQVEKAGASLQTIDEMLARGKEAPKDAIAPTPEDVAIVMYTSGTTGNPKGVEITHKNVAATAGAVQYALNGMLGPEDVYLAYLPLAHIMEIAAEISMLSLGVNVGYGNPHTLTDTGVKLKRPESSGDAPVLQPTFMVFAPAVLEKVYQAVKAKIAGGSSLVQTIFSRGLASGNDRYDAGQIGAPFLYDKLAFSKVRGLVGGRIKSMITGSAPLSPDIQRFIQTCFACPVRQGYGLTETCAASSIGDWTDNTTGTSGCPTENTVMRLADWPEGNYMNSDKDKEGIKMRRGEILIGGSSVCQGYLVDTASPDPEIVTKNKEDWVEIQGIRYFRTGDVGQITPQGQLQIIDRKKDLWKGPQGEYVALSKVEGVLKLNNLVAVPMVYGKTGGTYAVALICPQPGNLKKLAEEVGVTGEHKELCANDKVREAVEKKLKEQCKANKLVAFEIPSKIALIDEEWTPENDMLTAAMKLKRPAIVQKHQAQIDTLYK